jgi:hypothetical protein
MILPNHSKRKRQRTRTISHPTRSLTQVTSMRGSTLFITKIKMIALFNEWNFKINFATHVKEIVKEKIENMSFKNDEGAKNQNENFAISSIFGIRNWVDCLL